MVCISAAVTYIPHFGEAELLPRLQSSADCFDCSTWEEPSAGRRASEPSPSPSQHSKAAAVGVAKSEARNPLEIRNRSAGEIRMTETHCPVTNCPVTNCRI
jgi:hypothetical protein